MGVKDYDLNPDNNTQINGINIAEGCPPSGINNAMRQLMADVKEDSDAQSEALKKFSETPASAEELGPVKVGDGLTMGEDGTLSADLATAEAAGRVKASTTAQAGTTPLGGDDGTLGEDWLKKAMEAASAAKSAANMAKNIATWKQISTRSTTGQWTITDCRTDKPLIIVLRCDNKTGQVDGLKVISGAIGGDADMYQYGSFGLGRNGNNVSSNVFMCLPTLNTVVLGIDFLSGTLVAIQ